VHPIITDRRAAIADLCRRYGVRRLEVFGSALRDDFDTASSDIDLVVDFAAAPAGTAFDRYFDLKSALESLFARPVDLVQLHALQSPRLQRLIERAKVPVYAAPAESSTTAAWMSASVFMISKTVPLTLCKKIDGGARVFWSR
jgi:predicted nucleotidyltransferase